MDGRSRYTGMTVNERLFDAGLVDAFDTAVKAGNRAQMISILSKVDLADQAAAIAEAALSPRG
jgi:hypothetical protein